MKSMLLRVTCKIYFKLSYTTSCAPPGPFTTSQDKKIDFRFWILTSQISIHLHILRFPSYVQIFKLVLIIVDWVFNIFYADWCKRSGFESRNNKIKKTTSIILHIQKHFYDKTQKQIHCHHRDVPKIAAWLKKIIIIIKCKKYIYIYIYII